MKRNHINRPDLPSDFSLESLRDQNPFKVPDGYFDELPLRINERIQTNSHITKSRRLHPGVFAAAASVVVLLSLTVVMRTAIFNNSSEMQLSAIPDTHIVNHLENAIVNGEIDEPILMEAVTNAASKETATKATTTSTTSTQAQSEATGILSTVSDEAIIEYLVQNETPTNTTNEIFQ